MPQPRWTGTGELESPCYDRETKTDCPRRCGGCQLNCPDWNAYLEKRNELYKRRKAQYDAKQVIEDHKSRMAAKSLNDKQRLRRIH